MRVPLRNQMEIKLKAGWRDRFVPWGKWRHPARQSASSVGWVTTSVLSNRGCWKVRKANAGIKEHCREETPATRIKRKVGQFRPRGSSVPKSVGRMISACNSPLYPR